MRDFTKRLAYEEEQLNKKQSMFKKDKDKIHNGIFRVTAPSKTIPLEADFKEMLFDKRLGKVFTS